MKKIFSLLLIASMLLGTLALASCQEPANNNDNAPTYTNEVELMLLGVKNTEAAFARKDDTTAALGSIRNPKIDLSADFKTLAGFSLDASILLGDDFSALLLNELTFPAEEFDPSYSGPPQVSSNAISNIGAYFTQDFFALSVPEFLGEGYYGVKHENLLTLLETLLGPVSSDIRPAVEASFNNFLSAISSLSSANAQPDLPSGFTAFLSNLLKEKAALTKSEGNGNTILSCNLTSEGFVAILEGALAELRKDTAWKAYFDNIDATLKMANDAMSIDSIIAELKETTQGSDDLGVSYVVRTVYDSQLRIVESKVTANYNGNQMDALKVVAEYGEFSKMSVILSAYEESFDGIMKKLGDIVLSYEEKNFTETQKGFSFKMTIIDVVFGGMDYDDGIVGGDDNFSELSANDGSEDTVTAEIDYYVDSANNDMKLSLAVKGNGEVTFSAALLGRLTAKDNEVTLSVTKLEFQTPEQPGVTVSLDMNINVKISEMTAEDKIVPTYKEFTSLPTEKLNALKALLSSFFGEGDTELNDPA